MVNDLNSAWASFRRLQSFPVSYWKKISMLEALRHTMDKNNWKDQVMFDVDMELPLLVKEFQDLLNIN